MRIEDALGVLEITNFTDLTKQAIKKAYRRCCQKYHPDKGGSVYMMQCVNQAYDVLRDFDPENHNPDFETVDSDYTAELNKAINAVINLDGVIIEVCGNWVWLTGNTKPYSKEIGRHGAGFFWAKKKKAWYFRPSGYKSKSRGTFSLDDIREKHGSQFVSKKSANNRIGVSR